MAMTSAATFDEYNTQLQALALKATRNAALLPSDIDFHRSMDLALSKDLEALSARVLNLTNRLLALAATADPRGNGKAKIQNQDDLVDSFHSLVVDPMDHLLEGTDSALDRYLGRSKPSQIAVAEPKPKVKSQPRGKVEPVVQHAANLNKPQLSFKTKPDNSDTPWMPSLPHKYNAKVPFGLYFRDNDDENDEPSLVHPYDHEIKTLSFPPSIFTSTAPVPVKSFDSTPFHWVSTPKQLEVMLATLRNAHEIAIDLEHHDYRTFAGFLCLMQISTREADYVIDLLVLREEVHALNEVFTDPKIVKVLHGAESDIVWLQQDFNIYIVNMFDTYHASKVLDFPRHGLAHLLEMYCDFTPDKRYQLADWRIRPLPEEMLRYARSDTHFLLFIYDNLRNALLDRGSSPSPSTSSASSPTRSRSSSPSLIPPYKSPTSDPKHKHLLEVLHRSQITALNLYSRDRYDFERGSGSLGWDNLARKWNRPFLQANVAGNLSSVQAMQREVFRAVHAWRDRTARAEDESVRYVLPNHFLFQIAEQPPADMPALLKVFSSTPAVVRKRATELLEVIRGAVKEALGSANKAQGGLTSVVKPKPVTVPAPPTTSVVSSTNMGTELLWGQVPTQSQITAPTSTLFGSSGHVEQPTFYTTPTSTSSSVLFPKVPVLVSSKTQHDNNANTDAKFKDVIARIHSSLPIIPNPSSIPTSAVEAPSSGSDNVLVVKEERNAPVGETEIDTITGMQVDVPVSASLSQRQPKPPPKPKVLDDDDAIVVVGQSQGQKKRKRTRAVEDSSSNSKVKAESQQQAEIEPFDFSTAPNILDDAPDRREDDTPRVKRSKKERKKEGKGGNQSAHGDFPAPPRAYSQLKAGNQSFTFK